MIVTWQGQEFAVDADGFVLEYQTTLNPVWVDYIAKMQGIQVTQQHREIMDWIREQYEARGQAPNTRKICKEFGISPRDFYTLFPAGPGRGAVKMAGLPIPVGCV